MDEDALIEFIDYFRDYREFRYKKHQLGTKTLLNHLYEKYGREFIHSLPVECIKSRSINNFWVIQRTSLMHSVTEPAYFYNTTPQFYIFDCRLSLDEWLPYSALTPEEQILFKLKYG